MIERNGLGTYCVVAPRLSINRGGTGGDSFSANAVLVGDLGPNNGSPIIASLAQLAGANLTLVAVDASGAIQTGTRPPPADDGSDVMTTA